VSVVFELIAQLVLEVLCYGTGRIIAALLTPTIHAELRDPPRAQRRSFWALTYVQSGRRYYYHETLTVLGLLFWVGIAFGLFMAFSATGAQG